MLTFNKAYIMANQCIFNKRTGKRYEIPNELWEELLFCYGKMKLDEISKDFLDFLKNEKIIIESEEMYLPYIAQSEYSNMRLFIQLTGNCNLMCKHCFLGGSSNEENYFSLEKTTDIIKQAVHFGIARVDFTGGEISTIPYLKDLLVYLDGLPVMYSLFTNLAFTSEKIIEQMIKSKGLGQVITSIDYFESEKHDDFRGKKGAFNSTFANVLRLHEAGVPVTINAMILKDNHDDIMRMIDFFIPKGIEMHFDTIVEKGNAIKNLDIFKEDTVENVKFICECMKYLEEQYQQRSKIKDTACGVGKELLYVNKDGRFQLCPGLTEREDSRYYIGNAINEAYKSLEKFDLTCEEKNVNFIKIAVLGVEKRH